MPAILLCAVIFLLVMQSKSEAAGCLRVLFGVILVAAVYTTIRDAFHTEKPTKVQTVDQSGTEEVDTGKGEQGSLVTGASSQSFPFTSSSTGYTWRAASEGNKTELCRRLAKVSDRGNSASFYYDALDAFYNSQNASVLRQPIDLAVRMTDSGSSVLPDNQRSY